MASPFSCRCICGDSVNSHLHRVIKDLWERRSVSQHKITCRATRPVSDHRKHDETKEEGERLHEVNAGLLIANAELPIKTVGVNMLQQLYLKVDGILALKEEQGTALKAFLATGQWHVSSVASPTRESLELLPTCSTGSLKKNKNHPLNLC